MLASIVVAVLAIPVLAVVSIVMAMGTRERIKRLEFRIAGLEARLAGAGGEAALSQPVPSAPPEPAPDIAMAKAEVPAEPVAPLPAPAAFKLEERFGTQWVVWAGALRWRSAAIYCGAAPTTCRPGWSTTPRSCSPCCDRARGPPFRHRRSLSRRRRSGGVGLTVSLLLATLIGLERLRVKSDSIAHDWGARALSRRERARLRRQSSPQWQADRRTVRQSGAARLRHPSRARRFARLCHPRHAPRANIARPPPSPP